MTTAEEQVRHAEQGWIAIYLVGEQVERPELVVTLHALEQAGIVALPERADDGGAVFHYAGERQYRLSSATAKRSYRKGQMGTQITGLTSAARPAEGEVPVDERFAKPASDEAIEGAAAALRGQGFTVEVVDTADAARELVDTLVPDGAQVFTATSETLRESGIEEDIHSGRYDALRPRLYALDYQTQRDEIRRLGSAPDIVIGSVHAVTETGSLVIASATGSQLGVYASGAGRVIWVVGAQKIVPDLETALDRIVRYAYPLEDRRAQAAYGQRSAVRKVLIVNAEAEPDRSTVILIRTAIGF